MPRSVSSQDGALSVSPGVTYAAKLTQYLSADRETNNEINLIPNVCTKLKHHSSFKGNDINSSKLSTSMEHKRFSDFGIGSSSVPLNESNSLDSAHVISVQSPLVASSTSALSEMKLAQRFSSKNSINDSDSTTTHRPISLTQSKKSLLQQQQRLISDQLSTKNNSINSGLTVSGSACQNMRTMPLSPLARQSSSSMLSYELTTTSSSIHQIGATMSTTVTVSPKLPLISTSSIKATSSLNSSESVKSENVNNKKILVNSKPILTNDPNNVNDFETVSIKQQNR